MSRINLLDVTFIIPVRVDSTERLTNFNAVQQFLIANFNTNIHVLEADRQEKIKVAPNVKKTFVYDENRLFRKARYVNMLAVEVSTPYFALWDTDVVGIPSQIEESVKMLRNELAHMVFPYNRYFYSVPKHFKEIYIQTNYCLDILIRNVDSFQKMHGSYSPGGAFIIARDTFLAIGKENENFFGWGPEDSELIVRLQILGYCLCRVDGPLFHLYHARGITGSFASEKIEILNRSEFLKICAMHPVQLRRYIDMGFSDYIGKLKFQDLLKNKVSIISDDCWAGQLYQQLNIEYLTPTVGLYIPGDDYFNFIRNLQTFETLNFEQVNADEEFPVGKTPYATLYFQHYESFDIAVKTFKRRYKRIIWDQVFIKIDLGKPCYTESHIALWNDLKIPNSIAFFSPRVRSFWKYEIHNGVYVPDWEIDGAKMFDISILHFDLMEWLLNYKIVSIT
jgi:uncharacterized protein (DUF1919 family)